MKKILFPTVMLLISMLLISLLPTEAECAIYEDTIRLHILANSDEDFDQELKINIRDEVLKKYSKELSVFESIETAKQTLENKLSDIKEFTEEKIKEFGYSYPVSVSLSTEWYETRAYGEYSLPMGYYTSLRIIIGSGKGKNWWCVMFPPMCIESATKTVNYTDEEELLIKNKYTVKFKLLEVISKLMKK